MKYKIFKMNFLTNVHFGDGSLGKIKKTLYADTIFSALCHEAIKMGQKQLNHLVALVREDKIKISDSLPYIGDIFYIPKPLMREERKTKEDISEKKYNKRLEYIPIEQIEQFLRGEIRAKEEVENLKNLGRQQLLEKAAIKEGEDATPYSVGNFQFEKDCGLYFILAYERAEDFDFINDLLLSLSYTGIGGELTSGFGRFELKMRQLPEELAKRMEGEFQLYMSLSISLPREEEIESALEKANYTIAKRSGFVASTTYSNNSYKKKKDIYLLKAGSSFLKKFEGDIYDVSEYGSHPVYRYAKPLFMGVR